MKPHRNILIGGEEVREFNHPLHKRMCPKCKRKILELKVKNNFLTL